MSRNRQLAALSIAAVVALAACGDAADDGGAASAPMIKVAPGGASGRLAGEADAMSGDMASDMMIWMPTEYVLNAELPALDTPATGWYFPPSGELDAEAAARVIAALGLSGDPVAVPAELGGGWRLGPDDGTAPSIWFGTDGPQTWWFQPPWDDRGVTCVAEPYLGDPEVVPDAEAPVETTLDPATSDTAEPGDTAECAEPQPPVGVPDEATARQRAADLLTAMGVDPASYELQVYADEWSAWVDAWMLLDGKRAGYTWSMGFGENGALTYASGQLATPERTEPFPRVGTTEGFERLQEGGQDWWWGGAGATPFGSGDLATTGAAVDAGAPEPMPVEEPVPPVDQMEPQVVIQIVDVREDLWTISDADGGLWLVPAYGFIDTDGGVHLVPAIGDEVVEVVEPVEPVEPVEEPSPTEPTTTAAPEPTDSSALPADADLAALIGLTDAEAQAKVEAAGWVYRVAEIDGEPLMLTADYREDRVNVTLAGGVVTAATIG